MFRNLRAEMAREGLDAKKIASKIGMSDKAFRNKLHGVSEFTRSEMIIIKKTFFNHLTFAYLFELSEDDKKSA